MPSTKSAPRLVAKEFTIPSGWFRAPKAEGGGTEAISKAMEGGQPAPASGPAANRRPLIIAMCVAAAISGVVMAMQAPAHPLKRWASEVPIPTVKPAPPATAPAPSEPPTAQEPAPASPVQTAPSSGPSARAVSTALRASKPAEPDKSSAAHPDTSSPAQPKTSAKTRPPIY
jgi:hypothetical protein